MTILACLLLAANLLAFILVLASQRVSPSVCGGCGHGLAATLQRNCESCGGDLLELGITAGSVMRPPRRGLLILLAGILVFSLLPIQIHVLERELDRMHEEGPGYRTSGARYRFSPRTPLTNSDTAISLLLTEVTASGAIMNPGYNTITEAQVELSMVPPERGKGPPLRAVVHRGGADPYVYPRRQDVLAWFQQEGIFPDTPEGAQALERNVDHTHSQMLGLQNSSFSTGRDMNSVIGQSDRGRMPQSQWEVVAGWAILVFAEALLLVVALFLVVRFTRRVPTA